MHDPDPTQLRQLQVIALGLILGPIMVLGISLFLRATGTTIGDVEALSYLAIAFALASPMVAGSVRARMSVPAAVQPPSAEKARAAVIVPLAILEAAVFLCGIALLFTPTYWPLVAAAIPLGTMLAWFPRAG
jgi:hypothetical protein